MDAVTLKDFVEGCRTRGTGNAYRVGIIDFLTVIYGKRRAGRKCTDEEYEEYNSLSLRYLSEKRNTARDIVALVKWMQDTEKPPKSIAVRVTGVREWLKQNDISLSDKEKSNIRRIMPRKIRPQTRFDFFDYEKLQAVLSHLDIRMQALTLCLAASGARVSEILNARTSDLHDDKHPVSIYIRKTKTAEPRTVYITDEAYEALRAWFKVRGEYMRQAGERAKALKVEKEREDPRLFPFKLTVIYRAWHRALRKAGLLEKDTETGRNSLTVHRLRAWNRDRVSSVIGPDYAEIFLGHIDQYGNTYKDATEPTLREKYLLCQEVLTVGNAKRLKADMKVQATKIEDLEEENHELRGRLEKLERMNEGLSDMATESDSGAMGIARAVLSPSEIRAIVRQELGKMATEE